MPRKERLPRNVTPMIDRHGKRRYRFRKAGCQTVYFLAPPTEEEVAALRTAAASAIRPRHAAGTIGWLAARFMASAAFLGGKGPARVHEARRILDGFVAEFATDRVDHFRFDHIEAILLKAARPRVENGRRRGGPHAAINLRDELLPLFRYAIRLGLIKVNPVELAEAPKAPKGGFHTWTEEEIAQYRAHWPLGTQPRLALEIFLWTAQRRGDAGKFGPQHLKAGRVRFTASKTGGEVGQPAAPQLLAAIEASAVVGTHTFLITSHGKPFSTAGLGNKMREWCDAAGLPHCSAHGLRKAAARRAAEHGASERELMGLGGWSTSSQVTEYTRAVEQERMAGQALAPVIAMDLANRQT